MNTLKAVLALVALGCIASGCNPDRSEATQQMPASASAPNKSPSPPNNLPPQAQQAISKAAPPPSGGN